MIAAILFDVRDSTYLDIGSNFASCHRQINPAFSSFIRARIIRATIEWKRTGRVNNFCCQRVYIYMYERAHRAPFHSVDTRWILITQTIFFFQKEEKEIAPRPLLLFVKRDLFAVFIRSTRKIKRCRNFIDIKRVLRSLVMQI